MGNDFLKKTLSEKKELQTFGFNVNSVDSCAIGLSHVKMVVSMFVQYMNWIKLCANVSTLFLVFIYFIFIK